MEKKKDKDIGIKIINVISNETKKRNKKLRSMEIRKDKLHAYNNPKGP